VAAALIAALDSAWIVPSLVLAVTVLILLSLLRDPEGTYTPTPKTRGPGWGLGLGLGLTPFGPLPYASVHRRQTATAIILEPQKPVDT